MVQAIPSSALIRGYAFAPGKISRARCPELIPGPAWTARLRMRASDPSAVQDRARPAGGMGTAGLAQAATNSLGAGGQFDKVSCAMPDTTKRQLLRKGADLLGRVELAALLDVHASLLEAWISGHASMPDRQLLVLTHILDKVARK
jgi:hypothetical protein